MKTLKGFIVWQVTDVWEEGGPALRRKASKIVGGLLAVLPIFLVRLLRPFVLIRFGTLNSARIGHFVLDAEFYLCEREVGIQNPKAIDIFGFGESVSNAHFKVMCKRVLHTMGFATHLDRVNRWIRGGEKNEIRVIALESHLCRDVDGLFRKTKPHLSFTAEEERRGRLALTQMGLSSNSEFICFNARDSAYLDSVYPKWDWSYHDHRNSQIHNYIEAAEKMTRRGVFAFRMGAIVKEKINTSNRMIVDYANRFRSDFLDIYLSARCKFFLTTGTGIDAVAMAFRRPIVFVNVLPVKFIHSWSPEYISIPKKLWLVGQKRFMSFREILESDVGTFTMAQEYRARGIECVENTPEEICDVTLEMDERLKGTWTTTKEDEELQKKFWAFFKPSPLHGAIYSRLGAVYLRQNRNLLD